MKLSEWMDLARPDDPRREQPRGFDGIRAIGTNGLPWFAKWISYETPAWKRAFLNSKYSRSTPKPVIRMLRKPLDFARTSSQQLISLGPVSIPCLAKLMDRYPGDSSRLAVQALGRIGKDAVPLLLGVATNRAKPIEFRRLALDTIFTKRYPNPMRLRQLIMNTNTITPEMIPYAQADENDTSSLIPILIPCLHENGLEDSTIRLLGRLGLNSDTAFQLFANAITAKGPEVRIAAVRWGALFKSNAYRTTPELIKSFNDPEPRVRQEATNALERISPQVLSEGSSDVVR